MRSELVESRNLAVSNHRRYDNLSLSPHRYVHGCVQSCDGSDGCNGATGHLGGADAAASAAARTFLALLLLLFPVSQRTYLSPSNFLPLAQT